MREFCLSALLILSVIGYTRAAECGVDSDTGKDGNWTCLPDNTTVVTHLLSQYETETYHWVVEDYSMIGEDTRGEVTFRYNPCSGSASITVYSASPLSWDLLPSFTTSHDYDVNSIRIPAKYSEHHVLVEPDEATQFEMVAGTFEAIPQPGGNGNIDVSVLSSSRLRLQFNATTVGDLDVLRYRAYLLEMPNNNSMGCDFTDPSDSSQLIDPKSRGDCIFWTSCGIQRHLNPLGDWIDHDSLDLDANNIATFDVTGLKESTVYLINIIVENTETSIASAYSGVTAEIEFQTYAECVKDPNCKSQLHSDDTILLVLTITITAFSILLVAVITLKVKMNGSMKDVYVLRRADKAGGKAAMFDNEHK